jgi:hypothetical protein
MRSGLLGSAKNRVRAVRYSNSARASLLIGFSMSASGLGYFVFGLLPGTKYGAESLSSLSLWQAISFGFGLVISSPLNGVIYNELLHAGSDFSQADFQRIWAATKTFIFWTSALVVVTLLLFNSSLFESDPLLALLAGISIVLQIFASIQRAVFAARGQWGRFSSQFLVEGFGRVVLSGAVVHYSSSLRLLIGANVLSQILALVAPDYRVRWLPRRAGKAKPNYPSVLAAIAPYLLAGFTIQSTLSMTPFYGRTIAHIAPAGLAALGGLVQILRIPTTLTVSIAMPRVRQNAELLKSGNLDRAQSTVMKTSVGLGITWFAYGIAVYIGYLVFANRFTYGSQMTSAVLIPAAFVCVVGPVATYLHSIYMFQRRFASSTFIWAIALLVYVAILVFWQNSVSAVLVAVCCSLTMAIVLLSVLIRRGIARWVSDSGPTSEGSR